MFRIVGYNGNTIATAESYELLLEEEKKVTKRLRETSGLPGYHFEGDTKEAEQILWEKENLPQ